ERVCGRKAPNLVCLTDASTTTHELYGVRRMGAGSMKWGPVLAAGVKAVLHGNIQAQATGDQKMLSAAFIVDQTGTVRYTYYSQHPGDLPTLEMLIGA